MKSTGTKISIFIAIISLVVAVALGSHIVETVPKGHYHIKQAAVTGKMSAYMSPGMYFQMFGDVQEWPFAETFYFIKDATEGGVKDDSIEVRFNDGSLANISGSLRVNMPHDGSKAIDLITIYGYKNYSDVELKLIKTHVRNALRLTGNLMSARESYAEKRADFLAYAWDQAQHGLYMTEEEERKVKDPVSGEEVSKSFKVIKKNPETGMPLYQRNPLEGTGITISNLEIKSFVYSDKVKQQISSQQEALMGVETAAAQAKQAEQKKLTVEAEGKAAVMKAKYEEEEKKVKAVVQAQRDKEVAETQAAKNLEVAKLEEEAAKHYKQEQILRGQGEAKRKQLVMEADGALAQKLEVYERVMNRAYTEMGKQKWVPEVVMESGNGQVQGNSALNLIDMMNVQVAKQLSLDMKMKGTK